MKTIKIIQSVLLVFLVSAACNKIKDHVPVENSGKAPGVISNIKVENLPGAAKISYSLPADNDMLYVKAEYFANNKVNVLKSSAYNNSILVPGFLDTIPAEVKLYAVNKSELASDPVLVTVNPLLSPLRKVFDSLDITPDFGGVRIRTTNEDEVSIGIEILYADAYDVLESVDIQYIRLKEIDYAVRGFDSASRRFAVILKDEWGNISDTLFKVLSPIFEMKLDKSLFKAAKLAGDQSGNYWGGYMEAAWDDRYGWMPWMHTNNIDAPLDQPQWFTIDLGGPVKLSRFTIFGWVENNNIWNNAYPRYFDLYGSNNPDPNVEWDDSWVLLAECETKKPSGNGPEVPYTPEDKIEFEKGSSFNIPIDAAPYRYLRMKHYKNWSGHPCVLISEIDVFGSPQF